MCRTKLLRKISAEEAGSTLFLVCMLLLLGLLLAAGVFSLANASYRTTIHAIDSTKARYIAEAGIYRAIAQIVQNPDWKDGYPPTPFGEGTFFVQVTVQELKQTVDKPATTTRDSPDSKQTRSRIFNLRAEGSITTRARSVIEVSYKSDTGEILAWSE